MPLKLDQYEFLNIIQGIPKRNQNRIGGCKFAKLTNQMMGIAELSHSFVYIISRKCMKIYLDICSTSPVYFANEW